MKNKSSIWVGAIIVALISIVYGLILHLSHLDDNKFLGYLGMLIFIVAIIIVCIQFSKSQNGNVTFGNLFAFGFKTSAAVALLIIVWTVLMMKVIFPTYEDEAIQKATQAMVQKGLSQDQIDKGLEITRKFFMTFAIGGAILVYAIMGVVASVLGAAIAKKNPQANNPFGQ
jgi:hypothetical protein